MSLRKRQKSLKVWGVAPLLPFCEVVLVVVRSGCTCFGVGGVENLLYLSPISMVYCE